jgi:hypothetical protein
MAVRAMEKFAVLGIDSVGIAHSERATATNRDMSNVVPAFLPVGTSARTMSPVWKPRRCACSSRVGNRVAWSGSSPLFRPP